MMENNVNRLYWISAALAVAALFMTINMLLFPRVASTITTPLQGSMKQADIANGLIKKSTHLVDVWPDDISKVPDQNKANISIKIDDPNSNGYATAVAYTGNGGDVVIPKFIQHNGHIYKITAIGSQFAQNDHLTGLTLPDSVTKIDAYAFANNNIKSVHINKYTTYDKTSFDSSTKIN